MVRKPKYELAIILLFEEYEKEHKIRIKYQDIVYKICLLFDTWHSKCTVDEVVNKVKSLKMKWLTEKSLEEKLESLLDKAFEDKSVWYKGELDFVLFKKVLFKAIRA